MIRRGTEGTFPTKALEVIQPQKKDFELKCSSGLVEQDVATMLKIIMNFVKPSLKVGLKEFKNIIRMIL